MTNEQIFNFIESRYQADSFNLNKNYTISRHREGLNYIGYRVTLQSVYPLSTFTIVTHVKVKGVYSIVYGADFIERNNFTLPQFQSLFTQHN